MNIRNLAVVILALAACEAVAGPTLDPTFGTGGFVLGPAGTGSRGYALGLDGLVADHLNRVLFMSATDCGFHTGGIGCRQVGLRRIKETGDLDPAFGYRGSHDVELIDTGTPIYSRLALDSQHRIIMAWGFFGTTIYVQRLTEEGVVDTTFADPLRSARGFPLAAVYLDDLAPVVDVAAQGDQKVILVTGSRPATSLPGVRMVTLVRWTSGGTFDTSFGSGGTLFTTIPGGTGQDVGSGIAIQPDGKILVTGHSRQAGPIFVGFVARFMPDGSLDASFGFGGITQLVAPGTQQAFARRVAVLPDGRIVVVGTIFDNLGGAGRPAAARLMPDGTFDATFASGWVIASFGGKTGFTYDLAVQPNKKPVLAGLRSDVSDAAGAFAATTIRFDASGAIDPSWGGAGRFELTAPGFANSGALAITVDSAGRFLVSGTQGIGTRARAFVARILPFP